MYLYVLAHAYAPCLACLTAPLQLCLYLYMSLLNGVFGAAHVYAFKMFSIFILPYFTFAAYHSRALEFSGGEMHLSLPVVLPAG